ncbi:hypothetical protein [Legionella tunisiensis]|uniref:hypothetical protein n=1 Tax=Legionella tunisiensis TaxID=1034944 RepID=UPI000316CF8D|nr:hypothetical protein [Legionella tunisiensis]
MFFFKEPKVKRIARHLQAQLAAYHQDRWAHLLVVAEKTGMRSRELDLQTPIETPSWFRARKDFSWRISIGNTNIARLEFENASKQERHYQELLKQAEAIVTELNQSQPNYVTVIQLVRAIKSQSARVPSIRGGDEIEIKIGNFSGGNLFVDFFSGIGGLVYAPLMGLASVLASSFYYDEKSKYCGSPDFFLDTANYFCDSLCKVISSVLFPLAMLRSKYETDSYNPVKGELMRSLDSIVFLAEQFLKSPDVLSITPAPSKALCIPSR